MKLCRNSNNKKIDCTNNWKNKETKSKNLRTCNNKNKGWNRKPEKCYNN